MRGLDDRPRRRVEPPWPWPVKTTTGLARSPETAKGTIPYRRSVVLDELHTRMRPEPVGRDVVV